MRDRGRARGCGSSWPLRAGFCPPSSWLRSWRANAPQALPLKPEVPLARLGQFLTGPYVLAFELISVVLVVAMAGAVLLGFERRKGP